MKKSKVCQPESVFLPASIVYEICNHLDINSVRSLSLMCKSSNRSVKQFCREIVSKYLLTKDGTETNHYKKLINASWSVSKGMSLCLYNWESDNLPFLSLPVDNTVKKFAVEFNYKIRNSDMIHFGVLSNKTGKFCYYWSIGRADYGGEQHNIKVKRYGPRATISLVFDTLDDGKRVLYFLKNKEISLRVILDDDDIYWPCSILDLAETTIHAKIAPIEKYKDINRMYNESIPSINM